MQFPRTTGERWKTGPTGFQQDKHFRVSANLSLPAIDGRQTREDVGTRRQMFLDQGPTDPLRRSAIWAGDKDNKDTHRAGPSSHPDTSLARGAL